MLRISLKDLVENHTVAVVAYNVAGVNPKVVFLPLTLVPCDSGRDNQLRVKSPPMIVIIN